MKKQKMVIFATISLVLILTIGGKLYKKHQDSQAQIRVNQNQELLQRDYSVTKGNKDAKVKIVEFFDPACPTCADFYPLVENILAKHKGKIQLVLRYAPFHRGSKYVVKVLEASRKQDKFFQTLELLFKTQRNWVVDNQASPDIIWKLLPQVGINLSKLQKDLKDPKIAKRVAQDIADSKVLGVNQTPDYFVNGKKLTDFGYNQLVSLVNKAL